MFLRKYGFVLRLIFVAAELISIIYWDQNKSQFFDGKRGKESEQTLPNS